MSPGRFGFSASATHAPSRQYWGVLHLQQPAGMDRGQESVSEKSGCTVTCQVMGNHRLPPCRETTRVGWTSEDCGATHVRTDR